MEVEENYEYDSGLLNSMDDIQERERELVLNNKQDNMNKEKNKEKNKEENNESNLTKYKNNLRNSFVKYKNLLLLLLLFVLLNLKQLENGFKPLFCKLKLSDSLTMLLLNLFKGLLFVGILT